MNHTRLDACPLLRVIDVYSTLHRSTDNRGDTSQTYPLVTHPDEKKRTPPLTFNAPYIHSRVGRPVPCKMYLAPELTQLWTGHRVINKWNNEARYSELLKTFTVRRGGDRDVRGYNKSFLLSRLHTKQHEMNYCNCTAVVL